MYLSDYEGGQGEQLDGFFKSVSKAVRKVTSPIGKVLKPITKPIGKLITAIPGTKAQAQMAGRIALAIPTGGLSLARNRQQALKIAAIEAAAAAAMYGGYSLFSAPGLTAAESAAASDAGMLYAPAGSAIATSAPSVASTGWGFASGLKTATAGLNTVKDVFGIVALGRALMGQKGAPANEATPLFDTSQQGAAPQSMYSSGYAGGSGYSESSGGGGSSSGQGVSSELGPVADVVNSKTSLYVAGGVVALLAIAAAMKGRKSRRR